MSVLDVWLSICVPHRISYFSSWGLLIIPNLSVKIVVALLPPSCFFRATEPLVALNLWPWWWTNSATERLLGYSIRVRGINSPPEGPEQPTARLVQFSVARTNSQPDGPSVEDPRTAPSPPACMQTGSRYISAKWSAIERSTTELCVHMTAHNEVWTHDHSNTANSNLVLTMATFSFINILYCCRDDVQNVMTYKHT